MSTRFRLETLQLATTEGPVEYSFTSDMTVLAGPTGVGKTTLLELIKFGFGGKATLAPVATEHVESITLTVRISDECLRLTRSLDRAKRNTVRVWDTLLDERMPDHDVRDDRDPALNTLLLRCLGLPSNLRAAAERSKKEGARITFADIFSYLYIPQGEINRDIAHSQDNYRNAKRRAVFELLFGLTNIELLGMKSRFSELAGEIDEAETRHATVVQFLRQSNTRSREEAELAFERSRTQQADADAELAQLRDSIDPVSDRETRTLRDLLTTAERDLADARTTILNLARRRDQYTAERRRVQGDLDRLRRMRDANERLADIEFIVCPRCTQSIEQRESPAGSCRLCLQSDPVSEPHELDQYELRQIADQLVEMDRQVAVLDTHERDVQHALADRQQLISHLTEVLEQRTANRVSPRLQAYSDAAQQAAQARAEQQRWDSVLLQWDAVADLEAATRALRTERENVRAAIAQATQDLEQRRTEIMNEISAEFDDAVRAFGIPDIVTASVDSQKYLPVINGNVFSRDNQLSGGITTATQIAYWCSLVVTAMRHPETAYPAFLLIDSPRLALNTAANINEAMYNRLSTQVDVLQGRLQIIIADNELPHDMRGTHNQIGFDYQHPTISTIEHPGPARVPLLNTVDEQG